ncbi:MAG: hypothetical protein KDJ65_38740, partial [Anaerolineae bacterium]|nr:hypothetical protein [Anaerolineae bacterium]
NEHTLLDNKLAQRWFFDGELRFLNAYPYDAESETRMLPTPRSWLVDKNEVEDEHCTIHNFAVRFNSTLTKPKAPHGEYCILSDNVATLFDPARQVTVHNASQNRNRKAATISQLYRYDALAAEQFFTGIIVADDDIDLGQLHALLKEGLVTLGGSQSGGYGLVEITHSEIVSDWAGEYETQSEPGNMVILTLLSDVILQPTGQSMGAALAATLGVPEESLTGYQETRVIGGFNRKWGLPLPEARALRAGSVFLIPADVVDMEKLASLVTSGIGERRIDGFGRLAVNWHTQPTYQRRPAAERHHDAASDLRSGSKALATRMANQLLRRQLEQILGELIIGYRKEFEGLPSLTQLSRVRVAARHAILSGNLKPIETHLASLKLARQQWDNARLDQLPLSDWIIKQCQLSPAEFEKTFGLANQLPQVAGQRSDLPAEIRVEYQARLIDGVMKLAIEKLKAESLATPSGGLS